MTDKNLYLIWPTPIWFYKAPLELTDTIKEELLEMVKSPDFPTLEYERSNRGGFQSDMLGMDKFHPRGRKVVEEILFKICSEYIDSKKPVVDSWWVNVNKKGDWNMIHTHPNCDLSLVWYLTDGDICFDNPNSHNRMELGIESIWESKNKKGDIVVFPADLKHFVDPNPKEGTRISLAFNVLLYSGQKNVLLLS